MIASTVQRIRSNRRLQYGLIAVIVLGLAITPFTTDNLTGLVFLGLVFVILGISWNLLAGYAGQISLGHAAFFGFSAFVTAWLTTPGNAGLPEHLSLPPELAVLIGALSSGLLAALIGPVIFRLRGHYFAIGTLALAAIIQELFINWRDLTGGSSGYFFRDVPRERFLLEWDAYIFLLLLFATLVTVFGTFYVVNSRIGLGMQAVKGNEEAAKSLGVNGLKYKIYAFIISSFFAGLAGGMFALHRLFISPHSTLSIEWTIDSLVVVVLGGMGTMIGPIIGGVLFLIIDNLLGDLLGIIGAEALTTTVEGTLIIIIMIALPKGVWGYLSQLTDSNEPAEDETTEAVVESAD